MTRLIKGKRYNVEWQDFESFSEWKTEEELMRVLPAITYGTYWYVGKSKAGYIFSGEKNGESYGNSTIIPLKTILRVKPSK